MLFFLLNFFLLFRVAVIGKKFESIVDRKEKWYGTAYKSERIEAKELEAWKNAGTSDKLHMPPRNEFIPEQLDLVPREEVKEAKRKKKLFADDKFFILNELFFLPLQPHPFPITLKNTPLSRVWYKQDEEFLLPKAVVYIEMFRCE